MIWVSCCSNGLTTPDILLFVGYGPYDMAAATFVEQLTLATAKPALGTLYMSRDLSSIVTIVTVVSACGDWSK